MTDRIKKLNYMLTILCFWTWMTSMTGRVMATDSGGPLLPEQAAYDVTFYDLALTIDVNSKTIQGVLSVTAVIEEPLRWFVLDLDNNLEASLIVRIHEDDTESELFFERRGSRIWIDLVSLQPAGEILRLAVAYGGTPHEAEAPPWEGGFVWDSASGDAPWVGVACELDGADLWWPCKDHPSDEPDSMAVHFTVPGNLICASNGRMKYVEDHGNGTKTWHWFSSTPINIYNVTLNLAPYRLFEDDMITTNGDTLLLQLYLLPKYAKKSTNFLKQMKETIGFLESLYGPYPFRADKYGVAQTPYPGMEHQTIISYGGGFQQNTFGFDYILFHETTHEWWGNLITNTDWKDLWLHEGFAAYTEALYAEYLNGEASLHTYVEQNFGLMENTRPLAPREPTSADTIYGSDVYHKGAHVLHTLRYLLGDDMFFQVLRRMLYPAPDSENIKTGEQCRGVDSEDFIAVSENISGQSLIWFFDVYLRQAGLPFLQSQVHDGMLELQWITESKGIFAMPVDVRIGKDTQRVPMPDGSARIPVGNADYQIDPLNWILKRTEVPAGIQPMVRGPEKSRLLPAFPNPFNAETTCSFDLHTAQHTAVNIYDARGRLVEQLLNKSMSAGTHHITWQAGAHPSGIYIICLITPDLVNSQKVIYMK